jgi:hypothetical protein
MRLLSRGSSLLAILSLSLCSACGNEATVPDSAADGGGAGGVGGDGGSGGSAVVPAGTCRFVLRSGAERTSFEGRARAKMNGSGNLVVLCEGSDGAELELHFGNATFDGPRTYEGDDFKSDGSVSYTSASSSAGYGSSSKGGACTLVLSEAAPLDARGDSVEIGGRVAATFTCSAITSGSRKAEPSSFVVEGGAVAAVVE